MIDISNLNQRFFYIFCIFLFPESISTSEGPDANGLFTEKATLRKTLLRKDLGATFECRIETEALETIVRYQLKVDLQGKINCSIIINTRLTRSVTIDSIRWIAFQIEKLSFYFVVVVTVRPKKVEVTGVRQHTVQGSTVSLLCKVRDAKFIS